MRYGIADGNWFNHDITWLTEHDTPTNKDEQDKLYWCAGVTVRWKSPDVAERGIVPDNIHHQVFARGPCKRVKAW
eukprot:795955-Amphidinium_carterae.1